MLVASRLARRLAGALLVVATVSAAGCSTENGSNDGAAPPSSGAMSAGMAPGNRGKASAKVAAPGTYAVGSRQEIYVDRSRPTNANRTAPRRLERTLPTLVLYPAKGTPGFATASAGAPAQPGPWPLIVFSHGVTGTGPAYATTLRVWASAGYVVIAPDYPLSSRNAAGGPTIADVPAQVADVSFLLDQLEAASARPGPLQGLVDKGRIGLAGHSLGAITSLGTGYNACCADARVKAVAEWAGIYFPLSSGGQVAPVARRRPLLIVHGERDATVRYPSANAVYAKLGAPKFFVTLPAEGHVPPFVQGTGTPASKVTTLATLDFFDHFLKADRAGLERLRSEVRSAGAGVARLQEDPA